MGLFKDVYDGMKRLTIMSSRLERLEKEFDAVQATTLDHEKRLIRIETMIEIGQRGGISPRLED